VLVWGLCACYNKLSTTKKLVSNRNPVKEKEKGHRPLQSYSLTGFFAFLEV
jgi:hypothetical protein